MTTSIIICSIENFDPMGVHTGRLDYGGAGADADRPASTSAMRDAAIAVYSRDWGGDGRLAMCSSR